MLPIEFYLYLYIVLAWIIYVVNNLIQSYKAKKLKKISFEKKIEFLAVPFYIFCSVSFYLALQKLVDTLLIGNKGNFVLNSFWPIALTIVGIIFLFLSALLYTYVNFFVKSFPSCKAIKNNQNLQGIYNYIRHPSYYIIFLITFGTAFCLYNRFLFMLACINHVSFYFYFMMEENQIKKDSPYYNDYLKRTKRFMPNLNKSAT